MLAFVILPILLGNKGKVDRTPTSFPGPPTKVPAKSRTRRKSRQEAPQPALEGMRRHLA